MKAHAARQVRVRTGKRAAPRSGSLGKHMKAHAGSAHWQACCPAIWRTSKCAHWRACKSDLAALGDKMKAHTGETSKWANWRACGPTIWQTWETHEGTYWETSNLAAQRYKCRRVLGTSKCARRSDSSGRQTRHMLGGKHMRTLARVRPIILAALEDK